MAIVDYGPLRTEVAKPAYASLRDGSHDPELLAVLSQPRDDIRVPAGEKTKNELLSDFDEELTEILGLPTDTDEAIALKTQVLEELRWKVLERSSVTISGIAALQFMQRLVQLGVLRERRYRMVEDEVLGTVRMPAADDDNDPEVFTRTVEQQIIEERSRPGTIIEKLYGAGVEADLNDIAQAR